MACTLVGLPPPPACRAKVRKRGVLPPCQGRQGGGGWHKASVSDRLPLAAPIGLSPLLVLTLCGPERVLVVPTEPLDDLSYLTTPGSAVPGGGGRTPHSSHLNSSIPI